MLPLALGLVMGAGGSSRLTGRLGRKRVVTGGMVGVAVIGSIIGAAYAGDIDGAPAGADESIGAAHAVAARLGASGQPLLDQAGQAFTEAIGVGLSIAAAVAVADELLAWRRLPDATIAAVEPSARGLPSAVAST